jgi:hypothetical protein
MRLLCNVFLRSLLGAAGLGVSIACAQPAPSDSEIVITIAKPPIALEARPRVVPAPEWAVWRAFQDSLEFYGRQDQETVRTARR